MGVAGAAAAAQHLVAAGMQPAHQRREGFGLAFVEMVQLVELVRRQGGRIGLQPDHAMRCGPSGLSRRRAETRRMHAANQEVKRPRRGALVDARNGIAEGRGAAPSSMRAMASPSGVPSGRRPSASITGASA
jgi:hypothetical protein